MAFRGKTASPRRPVIAAAIAFAALIPVLGTLWALAVQWFVNEVVHGEGTVAARLFGKLAAKLPAIDPEWSAPVALIEALRDGFYGGFMLKSLGLIAIAVVLLAAIAAVRSLEGKADVWNGPRRSREIKGGARLERSKRAIAKVTGAWSGEVPAETSGLAVGYFGGRFRIVEFVNAQVFGSVGSGKSRRVLIPTIANLISGGKSLLVLDPKDELRFFTEGYAKEHGYRVLSLRLSDPARSPETYNPLSRAVELARAGGPCDVDDAIAEVATIASFVCPDSPNAANPYWTESARALFEGLALYTVMQDGLEDARKNLATVNALLTLVDGDGVTPLVRIRHIARELPVGHPAKAKLSQIAGAPDETAESVISTLTAKLSSYADQRISKALWRSSFELEDLGIGKTVLFVSFTNAAGSYGGVVSTLVTQAISRLMAAAEARGGRLENDVYLVFEEFAQIERLEKLATQSNLFRSCGIHLLVVLQERPLLLAKGYSDAEVRSILSTADDTLVLSVNDYATAEELSKRIGSYYGETRTVNRGRSTRGAGLLGGSSSSGQSTGAQRIPLLPPEDLLKWNRNCGNLLIRKDGAYAIPAPDLGETFLDAMLGRSGSEEEVNAQRAAESASMPILNAESAPVWLPRVYPDDDGEQGGDEAAVGAPKAEAAVIEEIAAMQENYNPLKMR